MADEKEEKGVMPNSQPTGSLPEEKEGETEELFEGEETPSIKEKTTRRIKSLVEKLKEKDQKLVDLEAQIALKEEGEFTDDEYVKKEDFDIQLDKRLIQREKEKELQGEFFRFKEDNEIGETGWEKIKGKNIENAAKGLYQNGVFTSYYESLNHVYGLGDYREEEKSEEKTKEIKKMGTGGSIRAKAKINLSTRDRLLQQSEGWDDERMKKAVATADLFNS